MCLNYSALNRSGRLYRKDALRVPNIHFTCSQRHPASKYNWGFWRPVLRSEIWPVFALKEQYWSNASAARTKIIHAAGHFVASGWCNTDPAGTNCMEDRSTPCIWYLRKRFSLASDHIPPLSFVKIIVGFTFFRLFQKAMVNCFTRPSSDTRLPLLHDPFPFNAMAILYQERDGICHLACIAFHSSPAKDFQEMKNHWNILILPLNEIQETYLHATTYFSKMINQLYFSLTDINTRHSMDYE